MSVARPRHRSVSTSVLAALLAVALSVVAPVRAPAQACFGPDGLDVPGACCQPVFPTLPTFPNVLVGGLGICWTNCNVSSTNNLTVRWDPPTEVTCAQYDTNLTVVDQGSGTTVMQGTLHLDYTRTWDELTTNGTAVQVWRFAAKADLSTPPGITPVCSVPTCLPPAGNQTSAFFYGYVDYACPNTAGAFDAVLVLYHACDRFIHRPGFSDKPGSYHPAGSYAIVAPHTVSQPFTPANMVAPSGGALFGEAARDSGPVTPQPFICISEDPVVSGSMLNLATGCVCTLNPNGVHHTLRQFRGQTACTQPGGIPGGWASLAINFPVNPWFHLVSSSIGRWNNPNDYPSTERAWVDEGIFVHQSACTGDWADIKYGGTTRGGWQPLLPIPVITTKFTDLADNYSAPLTGPYPTPILGSVRPTDRLVYVNY